MNNSEKTQERERWISLLNQEQEDSEHGINVKFINAVDVLNWSLSVGDDQIRQHACNLLKNIDKQTDIDVKGKLKEHGIDFCAVCPLTEAEINRSLGIKTRLPRAMSGQNR